MKLPSMKPRFAKRQFTNFEKLERDFFEIENAVNAITSGVNAAITQINVQSATQPYGGSVVGEQATGLSTNAGVAASVSHSDHTHGTPPYASYAKLGF